MKVIKMRFHQLRKFPFLLSAVLAVALFLFTRHAGTWPAAISDALFCLASGCLVVGLCLLLSNLKMFASFTWGIRFLRRIFRGDARTGREETEDYARYREQMGGHPEAAPLLILAVIFLALSFVCAGILS
ncbi:MAG: DUF3899 domain-containing protein [Clostridia bacterium]|nr:DUF3899 domain-containing protein [Clostridia bacterium]